MRIRNISNALSYGITILLTCILTILLIAPVFIYLVTFGGDISTSHQRWSEFGSYISGIYSPFISFLMVIVLLLQTLLQRELFYHNKDDDYIKTINAHIDFCISNLLIAINKSSPTKKTPYKKILLDGFSNDNNSISKLELLKKAITTDNEEETIFWAYDDINKHINHLLDSDEIKHKANGALLRSKLRNTFGSTLIDAINKYHKTITDGINNYKSSIK